MERYMERRSLHPQGARKNGQKKPMESPRPEQPSCARSDTPRHHPARLLRRPQGLFPPEPLHCPRTTAADVRPSRVREVGTR